MASSGLNRSVHPRAALKIDYAASVMRVLMVNWAPIALGASMGGGVNGYAYALAQELMGRGHTLFSLSSGLTYSPDGWLRRPGPISIRQLDAVGGIETYDIVNSPVVAPSWFQFRNPLGEVANLELESKILDLLRTLDLDVVHLHNIEGLTAGVIPAIRAMGATGKRPAIVYSLHNYHTICPQIYLIQNASRVCENFENGHACVSCVNAPSHVAEIRTRVDRSLSRVVFADPKVEGRDITLPVLETGAKKWLAGFAPSPARARPVPERFESPAERETHDAPVGTPFDNTIRPEPRSSREPNEYARRRAAMVRALNACDRVLAVSCFVADKFESLGVSRDRIDTLPIGTAMASLVSGVPARSYMPPTRTHAGLSRPIRLAFLGYHNIAKGLPVLVGALESLEPSIARAFDLSVHAKDVAVITPRLRRLAMRLARVVVEGEYAHKDIPTLVKDIDLGVVPSAWWDNGPQTVLEFLACGIPVLASNAGGIPDVIAHGHNGLLFRANDVAALSGTLRDLAANSAPLAALRANVTPPKSMPGHAPEIERVYTDAIARRNASAEIMST